VQFAFVAKGEKGVKRVLAAARTDRALHITAPFDGAAQCH
jgi:hypothetical protein